MSKLKHKSENKVLKTIRIIKNVIFAVILVALVGIIVLTVFTRVSGKTPSIMGFAVYRVSSGSMEPTLKVGEVILCRDCDPMELKNGDIITYEGTAGEFAGKNVTHRVVKEPYKEGSNYFVVTKGDNNPVEDSPISISQVTGIFLQKINLLTTLYEFFITPWGLLSLILLIILAFFNEIVIFVRAILGSGMPDEKQESVQDLIDRYTKTQAEKDTTTAQLSEEQKITDKAEILAIEERRAVAEAEPEENSGEEAAEAEPKPEENSGEEAAEAETETEDDTAEEAEEAEAEPEDNTGELEQNEE